MVVTHDVAVHIVPCQKLHVIVGDLFVVAILAVRHVLAVDEEARLELAFAVEFDIPHSDGNGHKRLLAVHRQHKVARVHACGKIVRANFHRKGLVGVRHVAVLAVRHRRCLGKKHIGDFVPCHKGGSAVVVAVDLRVHLSVHSHRLVGDFVAIFVGQCACLQRRLAATFVEGNHQLRAFVLAAHHLHGQTRRKLLVGVVFVGLRNYLCGVVGAPHFVVGAVVGRRASAQQTKA